MGPGAVVAYLLRTLILFIFIDGIALSDEKRLIKHLLDNYAKVGRVGRPVHNTTEKIVVRYGLALIQILDLDEKNQVLTTNCWSRYVWEDILLRWNPADFGGVNHIRIPTKFIWTPDIVLYNYADDRLREHRDAAAVVNHDGSVLWIPQAIFKSSCVIDITNFPFDKQNCSLKFGSWTYDGLKLDVEFYIDQPEIDLNDYIESNEWVILGHPARKNTRYYPCCIEPYPDLTFTVILRRRVAFYNYILILPCVLLSSLTLVLFWLPPESPAKMVLGMNIFVAFFVLLLLLAESTPPAASSIPLIGAYYCLNMIMITLSTFLSVIVINLYFRGDKRRKLPRWMKRIFIDFLAGLLCMRSELSRDGYNSTPAKVTTVGEYSRGTRRKRKSKMPEMKYNKFQMHDLPVTAPPTYTHANQNHTETTTTTTTMPATESTATSRDASPDESLFRRADEGVTTDVREIRRYLRMLHVRIQQKEEFGKITAEWRIVALVLDRVFFFMYVAAIIISLVTMFPRTY